MIRDFYTVFLLSMIIGGCDKHVPKVIEPSNTPVIENTASQEHAPEIREFDPQ